MKVFVVPDIHLKPWMLDRADDLIDRDSYDRIVFLGDFVDNWDQQDNIGLYDATFDAIRDFIKKHQNSLICFGNHDLSYVWQTTESGYSVLARDTVVARLQELRKLLTVKNEAIMHKIDNVLFSHAGLTRSFVMEHFGYDTDNSLDHMIECINMMRKTELWHDSSPIWARPGGYGYGYEFYSKGCLQVTGHTPVKRPYLFEDQNLLVCDTFSTYGDGSPIGDNSFVWVDTVTKEWGAV